MRATGKPFNIERLAVLAVNGSAANRISLRASWVSYAAGIPGLGVEQARRSLAIGEKLDNEMVRVQGYCLLGMGYLTDAQPAAAREALLTSAAIARERRAAVIMLPLIFGALAEAQVALGERGRSPGVGPGRH